MHLWRIDGDPKTDRVVHHVESGFGHALLSPMVAHSFELLGISAAVWDHTVYWMPLHVATDVHAFEQEHGREQERYRYNEAIFQRVLREKRQVRAEHAGLCDLFTPILSGGEVIGILVCGPFVPARPTSSELRDRFHWLTGKVAHPADPEFASYLTRILNVIVLDGDQIASLEELVVCLTELMAGTGRAEELANRAETLSDRLEQARFVDHMWDSARTMIDHRSSRTWQSVGFEKARRLLGISQTPEDVLVGLIVSRTPGEDLVDEALRRHAFQRNAAELCRDAGELLASKIGDHGVGFLSCASGPGKKRKQRLLDLAEQVTVLARKRHDLSLYLGLNLGSGSESVSRTFQLALGAAETALAREKRLVVSERETATADLSLRQMRQQLARAAEAQSDRLAARFERYLETVAAQYGRRIDSVRGHLDAGFERIAEPFVKSGALDPKSFRRLCEVLDRAANEARTADDLFAAYRQAVTDVSEARRRPVPARRERSLRAAIDHIHQHYGESLPLERVARVAGFNEDHFSKLFKQREGTTFEHYLRKVRLDHAQRLLVETEMNVARIAELTGFHSSGYFCRAFRQLLGHTPIQHRKAGPSIKGRRRATG